MAKNTLTFKPLMPEGMDEQIRALAARMELLEKNQVELMEKQDKLQAEVHQFCRAMVSFIQMKDTLAEDNAPATTATDDDLVEKYGRVCSQRFAAKLIGRSPRTVKRMVDDGRLTRMGRGVEMASITAYLKELRG